MISLVSESGVTNEKVTAYLRELKGLSTAYAKVLPVRLYIFPPPTLLPCSLVGFNCHKLARAIYKGKYGS